MIKLYRARSLLYRRQILQENIRWKALDEIYKIYMLLHRSDLNISEKFRQNFFAFFGNFLQNFIIFEFFSLIFAQILMNICRNFADISENVEIFQNLPDSQAEFFEIWQNFAKFATFAIFLLKFHENCCFFKPIFFRKF